MAQVQPEPEWGGYVGGREDVEEGARGWGVRELRSRRLEEAD